MKNSFLLLCWVFLSSCSYFGAPIDLAPKVSKISSWPIFTKPELPTGFKLEPTYESIRVGILEQKCLYCHAPGKRGERVPMNTKEDLINSPLEIVIPGNAEESDIILVLAPDARKMMPPLNAGPAPITEEEKNIIIQWINQGAN